jgi:hypothetical protein
MNHDPDSATATHVPRLPRRAASEPRRHVDRRLIAGLVAVLLLSFAASTRAQPVPLGTAGSFAVLGGSAVSNTGPSVVNGDLGIWPGTSSSVTGFPPGIVVGTTHFADATALSAQSAVTVAYDDLAGRACGTSISADLGGSTLVPGVYCASTSIGLTGLLTLDAQGDPNALFIFQAGSTLTTASASRVRVINGGSTCNVFWQVGSSATLGTGTAFVGNILALQSITVTTGAGTSGRLLARNGAVTLDNSGITACGAGGSGTPGGPGANSARTIPTLSPWMLLLLATLVLPLAALGLASIRR